MNEPQIITSLVAVKDGKVVTSSLKVAEVFSKRHADVIRAIESLQIPDGFRERNFASSEYEEQNSIGKTIKYPMCIMTEKGFNLLVMGFTGGFGYIFSPQNSSYPVTQFGYVPKLPKIDLG